MVHHRRLLVEVYKLADLVIMVGSFFGVLWLSALRTGGDSLLEILRAQHKVSEVLLYLGLAIVWHLILKAFGLYRSQHLSPRWVEAGAVFRATSLGSLVIVGLAIFFDVGRIGYWRWSVVVFWLTSTTASVAVRLLLRSILVQLRRLGLNLRDVLIVGTNSRARTFGENIQSQPEFGYRLIGFVDEGWPRLGELQDEGGKLVADLDGLADFLRRNVVDEVVLALPVGSYYPQVGRIVRLCEERKITVRFLSELFNPTSAQTRVEMFQSHPVVTIQVAPLDGWPVLVKRLLDFSVSLVLLIALSPLFLWVALLHKLNSEGPVFCAREHVGLNKRRFRLYSFVGRTGLDGLPQLFNVLKGEMSLVGPRPLTPRQSEALSEDWHRRRFIVRPGLTCLERISGEADISFARCRELDVRYVDRWTLWLDLWILARTILVMLRLTSRR